MVKKREIIYCENKRDFKGVVLEELLKMFAETGVIKIKTTKLNADRIALSESSDVISCRIINILIKGKANFKQVLPAEGKIIRPLYLFLDREILLYARLRRLKFRAIKEKKDKISSFIDELENKHPEIKHSIVKGYLELADESI